MVVRFAAIAAAGLLLAAFASLEQGDPIPNRDIVLEGEPNPLVVPGRTDERGRAEFQAREGRYSLAAPTVPGRREVIVARIEVGRSVQTSAPLTPIGRDRAYFMGPDGRRLVVAVPRGGARVRVTLTEAGPGAAPRNSSPRR